MIKVEVCMATQSWVKREYRRGLSTHPCGAPVLRTSEVIVLFPTFTTWGRPVRKYRTQLHRAGFRSRARWDRAVCSATASSVDLLGP